MPSRVRNLLASFALLIGPTIGDADDWPNWLGPNHDGKSSETLPDEIDLSAPAWNSEVGIGFSSVSVSDGRVYTMGHVNGKEVVWCLSENDGTLLWKESYEAALMPNLHEGGPGATPTVHDGIVYTISKDGQFHANQVSDGKCLWTKKLPELAQIYHLPEWGFTGSPVIDGDKVLVEAGCTFAFDRKTGEEIWRSEKFKPAYGSGHFFQSGNSRVYSVLKTDGLVLLDPADGKTLGFEKWTTSFQTNATTPLSIQQGQLFVSTGYDRGCALFEFADGKLSKLYENTNMCNHMGNSVLIDRFLYGFDGTAHRGRPVEFTCIDAATGEKKWNFQELKYGSVTAAGKDLIVLTEHGEMQIGKASPEGFQPRIQSQIIGGRCWTPPVYANGRIYARNATGRLTVIKVK